jgi:Tfp pilus assembly protein PilF
MYCGKCGQELKDDARFCNSCGNSIGVPKEEGSVPAELGFEKQTFNAPESPNETSAAAPILTKPPGTGKNKVIVGSILAVVLILSGFWGWHSFGTEARVQAKLDLAVKYLSENDYEKAILAFNDAIKIDPKEVKAYQGLARTYTVQGKYDDAKSSYDKGLAAVAADKKQTLQIGLAGMYIDQGQLDKAEQAFQEINNSSPSCLEAYFGLAMVYQQKGDNVRAEAMLRKAVENNPNEYRAYNTLALYLKQNNKTDDAFNNLVKSLSLEINQQEAYLILTDLYKGNWNALQSKASLVTDQQLAAMLQFYGYYAAQDYTKAITIFQERLSQQYSNQKARILAGIAMLRQGDKPGAEALIKQLTKEKLNDWLTSDLARYYLEAGDKDRAKEYALKALKANPTNLDAIAILQVVNSTDASVKVYTAQALLYNWKPVVKVKEELKEKSLIVLDNSGPAKTEGSNQQTSGSGSNASSEPQVKSQAEASQPVSLEVIQNKEIWVKYADGHKELLAKNSNQPLIDDNPQFSLDRTKVYFTASAGTLASCFTYVVYIKDKKVKQISFGWLNKVINEGEYKGNIIVSQHHYYGPPNYGSYDQKCVVDDNGTVLTKLN